MLNPAARKLYEDFVVEDDKEAAETIYSDYLHVLRELDALREPEDTAEDELDDYAKSLPIGVTTS